MLDVGDPRPSALEVARLSIAPVIALVAASLGVLGTAGLVALLGQLTALSALSERFVGWLGLGWFLAVAGALAALVVDRRLGAGPSVAIGGVLGPVGLLVSRDVASSAQVAVAIVLLGAAAGLLLGGAASIAFELNGRRARLARVFWAVPLVATGSLQAWAAARQRSDGVHLTAVLSPWLVLPLGAVLVAWGLFSLIAAEESAVESATGWREAWWSVTVTQIVLYLVVMLIGFDAQLRLYWLRPVVLVASSLALAIWVMVSILLPEAPAKIAFLAVSFVAAAVPPLVQLLFVVLVTDPARPENGSLLVILVAAVMGGLVGWWWPRRAVVGGLALVSVASAGSWLVRGDSPGWPMAVAGLVGGASAVAAGGVLTAHASAAASRLVGFASISALVVGTGIAVPLGWALVGDLPLGHREALATSRVIAGLVFSLSVLLAAYVTVLGRRIDRRSRSEGISEWGGAISFPGVGGAVIHGGARPESPQSEPE